MIEKLKKLFSKDKSIELQLIDIIKQQQAFIAKNITERVVYVDPQTGYTNVERFDDPNTEKEKDDDDEFQIPEEMTPEKLQEIMEGQEEDNSEEGKK